MGLAFEESSAFDETLAVEHLDKRDMVIAETRNALDVAALGSGLKYEQLKCLLRELSLRLPAARALV